MATYTWSLVAPLPARIIGFLAFTAFVGVNLLQSALTNWCLMETIMRKLGARPGA